VQVRDLVDVLSFVRLLGFVSNLINALIVGLIQGLIEWLPISSQGNLVIIMIAVLGLEPTYALGLAVYLHMGTGLAAAIYFRKDISRILRSDSESDRRMLSFLVITTVLTGVVGLPLFLFAQLSSFYGEALLGLTGVALISTGIVQRTAQRSGSPTAKILNLKEGLLLGLVQGFSALPGVSRSGVTTSALLLTGFEGEDALRISFLMSIPAVFAAAIGLTMIQGVPELRVSLLIALVASFISALLSINILLRAARKLRFWGLCLALGVLALLPLLIHLL